MSRWIKKLHLFIFGIKHLNKYLQKTKFVTERVIKFFATLRGHDKKISEIANPRMQRTVLILSSYDHTVKYKKKCKAILLADALSCLPCKVIEPVDKRAYEFVYYFAEFAAEDLTTKDIETSLQLIVMSLKP